MKLNYFNFKKIKNKYLLTNDFGRYEFVSEEEFKKLVSRTVVKNSELWDRLVESKMIYSDDEFNFTSINKYELRDIKNHLISNSTALHIFVVNTACNMRCVYCQANNGKAVPNLFMTKDIAEKAVDIALQSPNEILNFEFQGGEPLLNYEIIKHIVEYTEINKGEHKVEYNVVTNLTLLNDEMLDFFVEHNFGISTSLDGSEKVHNYNRPFADGKGSYECVVNAIKKVRNAGLTVGAIETTTRNSLAHPEEIVQSYVNMGFDSIFVRPLTPLGKALVSWENIGYTADEFNLFYKKILDEIIKVNKSGVYFKEAHASIFLRKIEGESINYMELRSPCGAGIGQLAYFADGNIFTCDEGRMLYEMGQDTFRLGNVFESSFRDIIDNGTCKTVCTSSMLESIPSCCDCVYQPYCGTCPVVTYAIDDDILEKEPRGYKCKIYSNMLNLLFEKILENDIEVVNILNSWSN